ncbi:hypothetical protein ACPCHQ_11870 [Ralstonia thomasii]|jgi:hypothetical protein|uniref:Uncharacterized protein n=2 Tax=Ralstonia TaxID=48736 RepID=A0ABM9JG62_9RALS|nr:MULTISPECIES: hypothetical protein [Ralstonia]MBT2177736.1 hypothetical protein [Ralstonia pickettii]CAJ0710584.1 hypothetical protein LMG7143_01633 [Ralstonia sp. LMG 18095]CAJ0792252.1 hypothetical protein LMG18095_02289 [Ralstonia sp. LMG 18095]
MLSDAEEWDRKLEAWLACYQHLEPQMKDAERWRYVRNSINPSHVIHRWDDSIKDWKNIGGSYVAQETIDAALDLQKEKQDAE